MNTFLTKIIKHYQQIATVLNSLQPIALLSGRTYVSWVFFAAGLTKIQDWETTLWLFEEEYSVPFLNSNIAAFLGTGGELLLPILLISGLGTRFAALGLTVVNIVAVISLEEIAPAALMLHFIWGIVLLQNVLFGAGSISLDKILKNKL